MFTSWSKLFQKVHLASCFKVQKWTPNELCLGQILYKIMSTFNFAQTTLVRLQYSLSGLIHSDTTVMFHFSSLHTTSVLYNLPNSVQNERNRSRQKWHHLHWSCSHRESWDVHVALCMFVEMQYFPISVPIPKLELVCWAMVVLCGCVRRNERKAIARNVYECLYLMCSIWVADSFQHCSCHPFLHSSCSTAGHK